MASRYDAWDPFFAAMDGEEAVLTFDDLEELTGVTLPPVARRDAPWWSNTTYWAANWVRHGWYASPDIPRQQVRFSKKPPSRGRKPGRREKTVGPPLAVTPRSDGPGERVLLVGCVSSKAQTARAAKDLYTSDLWSKRRTCAESRGLPWFILSAKYGLLHPDQVIEPYDVTLAGASAAEATEWAETAAPQVIAVCQAFEVGVVEVHAGEAYTPFAFRELLASAGIRIERPLEGLRFGEQLAWYGSNCPPLARSPERPGKAALPPEPLGAAPVTDTDGRTAEIVARLLDFGNADETLPPEVAIFVPENADAERYLHENPFAFLVAVIFDQGIVAERAWEAPYLLRQRLGHLDPERLFAMADEVRAAVAGPPALHRYVNNVPSWVVAAAIRVVEKYGSNASNIWSDNPSAAELQRRFEEFAGIGPKKAAMAVEILITRFGCQVRDWSGTNLAYDVHVRRVFLRTGLAERDDQRHMIEAARRLYPERPGLLDGPAWTIGRTWCHPRDPECDACVLGDVCPRYVARGDGVTGN